MDELSGAALQFYVGGSCFFLVAFFLTRNRIFARTLYVNDALQHQCLFTFASLLFHFNLSKLHPNLSPNIFIFN